MKEADGQKIFNALMETLGDQVDPVDLQAAGEQILERLNGGVTPRTEECRDGMMALARIVLQEDTRGVPMRLKINDAATTDDHSDLADFGLKIEMFGTQKMVAIAKTHPARNEVFGEETGWRSAIRRLPGAVAGDGRGEFGERRSRYLLVPLALAMQAQ